MCCANGTLLSLAILKQPALPTSYHLRSFMRGISCQHPCQHPPWYKLSPSSLRTICFATNTFPSRGRYHLVLEVCSSPRLCLISVPFPLLCHTPLTLSLLSLSYSQALAQVDYI
ncbi:hypothetical protein EDB86DRAFT_2965406 [Lactarius hatsudake]|nr:hypothetical protein EDB86DRAFT_2965406 [Lactarius hatsudake]